jgi:hypothetical protein
MQVHWAEAEVCTSCLIHEHHTSRDTSDILTLSMQRQMRIPRLDVTAAG